MERKVQGLCKHIIVKKKEKIEPQHKKGKQSGREPNLGDNLSEENAL